MKVAVTNLLDALTPNKHVDLKSFWQDMMRISQDDMGAVRLCIKD